MLVGCVTMQTVEKDSSKPLAPLSPGLSLARIEKLVKDIRPGMSPGQVKAIVGSPPWTTAGDVWIYRGDNDDNADMESDLAVRFRDGTVVNAWVSWTCNYYIIRD